MDWAFSCFCFVGVSWEDPALRFGTYAFPFSKNALSELFLARLNPTTGAFTSAVSLKATTDTNGYNLLVQGNTLTLAGTFEGTMTFQTTAGPVTWKSWGAADAMILRLAQISTITDPVLGDLATPVWSWVTHLGSVGGDDLPEGLSSDGAGSIFVVGQAFASSGQNKLFLGPQDPNNPQLPALQPLGFGGHDGFVAKLDASGKIVWGGAVGGELGNANAPDNLTEIAYSPFSSLLYLVGWSYTGTLRLGSRTRKLLGHDFYLWQMAPCPPNTPLTLDCYPK